MCQGCRNIYSDRKEPQQESSLCRISTYMHMNGYLKQQVCLTLKTSLTSLGIQISEAMIWEENIAYRSFQAT